MKLGTKYWEGGEEGEDFGIAWPLRESDDIYMVLSLKILS